MFARRQFRVSLNLFKVQSSNRDAFFPALTVLLKYENQQNTTCILASPVRGLFHVS
jgi:hypothetical protein